MDEFKDLNDAIEEELHCKSLKVLTEKAKDLRSRYRDRKEEFSVFMQSKEEKLAYVGYRMKATLGAIHFVLKQLIREIHDHNITSVLDLGAGPGTSLWSFPLNFPEIKKITLLEKDQDLIQLGKRLFSKNSLSIDAEVLWQQGDFLKDLTVSADLVLFSYSFGEMSEYHDLEVLKNVFSSAHKFIVIIEPGTPVGYKRILKARKILLDLGAHTLAPCPHDKPCPLTQDDWCHFSTRIQRTSLQRLLKEGSLNFEDEKFSYIIMGKKPQLKVSSRVLDDPKILKEKINMKLCTEDGLKYQEIPRRDGSSYKKAKKIKNGDNFSLEIN